MDTQKTTLADISAFNTNLLLPKTKTYRSLGAKPVTLAPHQPDSFTPQQQTAKKTQTQQPKKEEEKSWLLPVAVGTGILALVGLVIVCSNTEIREKLLPFLKKKTEGTVDTASEQLAGKGNPPPPPDDFSNPPPPQPNGENDLSPNLTIPLGDADILQQLVDTHPEVKAFLAIEQEILALQATLVTDANKADVIRQILAVGKKLTDYHNNSKVLTDGTLDSELTTRREAVTQALKKQLDYVSNLNSPSGQTSLETAQVTAIEPTNPTTSQIVPKAEDPSIAPTAGEKQKENLWNSVVCDIQGRTYVPHWNLENKGLPNPNFTTADFYHFQEQCLAGLKNPNEAFNKERGGLFQPAKISHNRIKNILVKDIEECSVSGNILDELRKTGVGRGLSSEDNHLALAYAYYNHALLLCAAGATDSVVRRAFKNCVELLEPVHYVTRGSDGQFFYEKAKGYLVCYTGTDAHITAPSLPTAKEIDGLLPFPVFQSEVAHHNLKQATETLKTHLAEAQKATQMNLLLAKAETYYARIIKNPEMANRWHGHAGMAEVLALKSKLAKREGDADSLKEQAQEQLKLAKERSRETEQAIMDQQKLSYKYGNTLPSSQEYRISKLLQ